MPIGDRRDGYFYPTLTLMMDSSNLSSVKDLYYVTGENPVSWLAQFVFINLYVYLETGLNRSTS